MAGKIGRGIGIPKTVRPDMRHYSKPGFRIGFKSDTGGSRRQNQDSFLADPELGLFIVADGMGGHNAGEVASELAVQEIAGHIRNDRFRSHDPKKLLEDAVLRANLAILGKSATNPEWSDMGTTVVAALYAGDRVIICHVGDSRAYMVTKATIRQLTQDHSFVAEWVKEGLITAAEARTHEARRGLYMALGVEDEIEPELSEYKWDGDWSLCLCSDGLNDAVEDDDIRKTVIDASDPHDACDALIRLVHEREGSDDVTVILVCQAP
ncbi:MAG: Stp1/IreP family PP2C-type Ser/Thr phosphatase [Deltaproteobacteria bacterium]|nr:Stp1/IreP family PP2C-type Ser/Thr phosphatase [Deltaproteobacteria bacterium]